MDDQRGRGAGMTGPGFVFVRGFLWWMLAIFAALGGMAAFLSWYFAMDLSIKARGQLRPAARHGVKASLGGIVREVRVREGQQVAAGETLAVLDDAEWRLQLAQIASDLRANRLRVAEIEASVSEQRRLLQLEEEAAQAAWQRSRLGLEQVRAEQQVGSLALLASYGWKRKPLAELWPVRRAAAAVGARRAEWESARARWQQAGARLRERQTLDLVHGALVADRAYAEQRLAQTALVAPVAGAVLTRDVAKRRGDYIGAGEVLLDLASGGWMAEVAVAERDLPRVAVGQWARLYVEAYPHMEYEIFDGIVDAVAVDKSGGGYPVEVVLADSALAVYRLAPGLAVEARIVVERGRIAALAWRRILEGLGKVRKGELYAAPEFAAHYGAGWSESWQQGITFRNGPAAVSRSPSSTAASIRNIPGSGESRVGWNSRSIIGAR